MLDQFFVGNAPQVVHVFPRYRELMELRNLARPDGGAGAPGFPDGGAARPAGLGDAGVVPPAGRRARPGAAGTAPQGARFHRGGQGDDAPAAGRSHPRRAAAPPADGGIRPDRDSPRRRSITRSCRCCATWSARARRCPACRCPTTRADFAPDAAVQVKRALELSTRVFGRKPCGMWPAEGSVSMDILPLLREHGIRWIATDEQILARVRRDRPLARPLGEPASSGRSLPAVRAARRRNAGHRLPRPRALRRHRVRVSPRRLDARRGELRLARLRRRAPLPRRSPRLISVILDGENPWDITRRPACRSCARCSRGSRASPDIRTTRLSDYIAGAPAREEARAPARRLVD